MKVTYMIVAASMLASSAALSRAIPQTQSPAAPARSENSTAQKQKKQEDAGAMIFAQNCGRCHNAPEGFSPRISGTITQHMRVRASLSKHEEEELLHFLNP